MPIFRNVFFTAFAVMSFAVSPLAAQPTEYATDTEEADIVLVPRNTLETADIADFATLRVTVPSSLSQDSQPVKITIFTPEFEQVDSFTASDEIAYIRLPEGMYYLSVEGRGDGQVIAVESSYGHLRQYSLQTYASLISTAPKPCRKLILAALYPENAI